MCRARQAMVIVKKIQSLSTLGFAHSFDDALVTRLPSP